MKLNKRIIIIVAFCLALPAVFYGCLALSPRPTLLENTSFSTAYYGRDGALLRLSLAKDQSYRLYTKLEDISHDLVIATLTQEDQHFYYHPGVNPVSLVRGAFETYVRRSRSIGGSTITMQLVRMRDGLNTRTIGGKLTQIMRALQLEAHYSKKDILEAYLNLAPYGGNIHGAGTASLIYFKQPVKNLALPQSLALAVIPQNPVKRFPLRADNSAWDKARLRLFRQLPAKDYKQYAPLMNMKLSAFGRNDLPFLAPHFVNGLLKAQHTGIISTTIDLRTQKIFEHHISAYLARRKSLRLDNAVAMLLHFPSMEVRALSGSARFFDARIDGQVDGTLARRSPGSTLKPFVYALALEQGLIHPETLLDDRPVFFSEYRPGNFDKRFIGAIPAREALVLSRNIPAISLAKKLNKPKIYDFLQTAGAGFPKGRGHYGLSLVVGGAEIDMRSLTKMYAMLANGGVLRDIQYTSTPKQEDSIRLLSKEAALLSLNMLERPRPNTLPFSAPHHILPAYWKTGTSNGFRDAWSIGIFGPYVLAVWVGHFDGHANPALIGSHAATPLFFDLLQAVHAKEKLKDYIAPAIKAADLTRVFVCPQTGEIAHCRLSKESWFIAGTSPFSAKNPDIKFLEILSPRENISYAYSYKNNDALNIPLEAKDTDDQATLYWFADNQYLGSSQNHMPLFWKPEPGEHTIRAIDEKGHADSKNIMVIVSE